MQDLKANQLKTIYSCTYFPQFGHLFTNLRRKKGREFRGEAS